MRRPARHAATYILFGGTGDLARRMILPALHRLHASGAATDVHVVAVTRGTETDAEFRALGEVAVVTAGATRSAARAWARRHLHFQSIGEGSLADFEALGARLAALEAEQGLPCNRIFYLALPPVAFAPTAQGLARAGLADAPGYARLVVEKPFGHDLESARDLNAMLHEGWREDQLYRIDHYLGKETVQNLLVFRFANAMFESLWNRSHVQSVQVTVAETIGIAGWAPYDDRAVPLRADLPQQLVHRPIRNGSR